MRNEQKGLFLMDGPRSAQTILNPMRNNVNAVVYGEFNKGIDTISLIKKLALHFQEIDPAYFNTEAIIATMSYLYANSADTLYDTPQLRQRIKQYKTTPEHVLRVSAASQFLLESESYYTSLVNLDYQSDRLYSYRTKEGHVIEVSKMDLEYLTEKNDVLQHIGTNNNVGIYATPHNAFTAQIVMKQAMNLGRSPARANTKAVMFLDHYLSRGKYTRASLNMFIRNQSAAGTLATYFHEDTHTTQPHQFSTVAELDAYNNSARCLSTLDTSRSYSGWADDVCQTLQEINLDLDTMFQSIVDPDPHVNLQADHNVCFAISFNNRS